MLVIDASCLVEVLVGGSDAARLAARLRADSDQLAPHLIDLEVFGVIRWERLRGTLDPTAAVQAVEDLRDWPGERIPHGPLLTRAYELHETVRGWDAMYVALAEAFAVPLLTRDRRLAAALGPTCEIELI